MMKNQDPARHDVISGIFLSAALAMIVTQLVGVAVVSLLFTGTAGAKRRRTTAPFPFRIYRWVEIFDVENLDAWRFYARCANSEAKRPDGKTVRPFCIV